MREDFVVMIGSELMAVNEYVELNPTVCQEVSPVIINLPVGPCSIVQTIPEKQKFV